MHSRLSWLAGLGVACSLLTSLGAEEGAGLLLPKTQSRLKPVIVVAALEVPLVDVEPAVVAQAVALEAVQPKYQVVPAVGSSPVAEAKSAPVVPSWSLPMPVKKATSIPVTNPYVTPRAVR